jgi:predicted aconitase with swiveling domain
VIVSGPSEELRPLHPGTAEGTVQVLDSALSFWGGVDRHTGAIIDVHHPQHGLTLAHRVLVMPAGRGSSSSSSVLAEVIRNGVGPVAIILLGPDLILSLGVIVAAELYAIRCPVVAVSRALFDQLQTGDQVRLSVTAGAIEGTAGPGTLQVSHAGSGRHRRRAS